MCSSQPCACFLLMGYNSVKVNVALLAWQVLPLKDGILLVVDVVCAHIMWTHMVFMCATFESNFFLKENDTESYCLWFCLIAIRVRV